MRLEVLHVPQCPNAAVLRARLAELIAGRPDIRLTWQEVTVEEDAARLGMAGSPTLLVDGTDPFARPGDQPSISCRLYPDDHGQPGPAPTLGQLRDALAPALELRWPSAPERPLMSGFSDSAASTPPAPARTINLVKDPTGAPAVNLAKVREAGHIDLVKRAEKAGISLSKRNLSGLRGAVRLYVDHSGSMEFPGAKDYSNGNVQRLVERALGYAFQLDSDGKIPVIAFDNELWPEVIVDQSNYEGIVEARIWHRNKMGGTLFVPVLEDLLNEARTTQEPIFAIIVTDGSPSDRTKATELVIELAKYPVQIKFLAIREADYLRKLDDLEERKPGARLLDNVDAKFFDGEDCPILADITDLQFADAMADEIDTWVSEATAKGVLT